MNWNIVNLKRIQGLKLNTRRNFHLRSFSPCINASLTKQPKSLLRGIGSYASHKGNDISRRCYATKKGKDDDDNKVFDEEDEDGDLEYWDDDDDEEDDIFDEDFDDEDEDFDDYDDDDDFDEFDDEDDDYEEFHFEDEEEDEYEDYDEDDSKGKKNR